ncbi:hypothetical protein [Streptomyces sp. NPDC005017]|uniref:hypothetical protein n=1 Tax=Streptomyces sp. NPDC005017 TaxID=3364706 RepID=UPI00368C6DBA
MSHLPPAARRASLRAASGREHIRVSPLRRPAALATTPGLASLGLLDARTLVGSTGRKVVSESVGVGDLTDDARADLVTTGTSGCIGETCRGVGCQITRPGRGDGTLDPGEVSDPYRFGLNGTF